GRGLGRLERRAYRAGQLERECFVRLQTGIAVDGYGDRLRAGGGRVPAQQRATRVVVAVGDGRSAVDSRIDRKSTRLNSSHQITTLSLHDALPICGRGLGRLERRAYRAGQLERECFVRLQTGIAVDGYGDRLRAGGGRVPAQQRATRVVVAVGDGRSAVDSR